MTEHNTSNSRVLSAHIYTITQDPKKAPFSLELDPSGSLRILLYRPVPSPTLRPNERIPLELQAEIESLTRSSNPVLADAARRILIYIRTGSRLRALKGSSYKRGWIVRLERQVVRYGPDYLKWRFSRPNPSQAGPLPKWLRGKRLGP